MTTSPRAPARGVLDKAPESPGTPPGSDKVQLPHERDESAGAGSTAGHGSGAAGEQQRRVAHQAAKDLAEGQVDTDMHATPGLDAQRRDALTRRGRSR